MRSFSFSVPASVGSEFEGLCASERINIVDKLASLVYRAIEARTGIAIMPKVHLNGLMKTLFDSVGDSEQFTVPQKARQLGTQPMTLRYALSQLVNAGLLAPAGAVATGSRYAESYRITDLGRSHRLSAEEVTEDSKAEQRARVRLFLLSEGFSSAESLKLIEDEEMICHMSEVKMDYSMPFWRQWLKDRRQVEAENAAEEAEAQATDID